MNKKILKVFWKSNKILNYFLILQSYIIINIYLTSCYYWNDVEISKIVSNQIIIPIMMFGVAYSMFYYQYIKKNRHLFIILSCYGMNKFRTKLTLYFIELYKMLGIYFVSILSGFLSGKLNLEYFIFISISMILITIIYSIFFWGIILIYEYIDKKERYNS